MKKLLSTIMLLSLTGSLCAMEGQREKEEKEQSENGTIMTKVTWDFLKGLPSDVALSIISYLPLKERLHVLAGLLFEIKKRNHPLFNREELMKSLLKKEGWGIKISHLVKKVKKGKTLAECDVNNIRELIQNGANINAQDNSGKVPLYYATYLYWLSKNPYLLEVAHMLLDAEANVNIRDRSGNTPLVFAAEAFAINVSDKSKLLIKALIKNGADPTVTSNLPIPSPGRTPKQILETRVKYLLQWNRLSVTDTEALSETIEYLKAAEEAWEQKTANKDNNQ